MESDCRIQVKISSCIIYCHLTEIYGCGIHVSKHIILVEYMYIKIYYCGITKLKVYVFCGINNVTENIWL